MEKVKFLVLKGKSYPVAFGNTDFIKFGKIQNKTLLELQDHRSYSGNDLICLAKLALQAGAKLTDRDPDSITDILINEIVVYDTEGFRTLVKKYIPELLKNANIHNIN